MNFNLFKENSLLIFKNKINSIGKQRKEELENGLIKNIR